MPRQLPKLPELIRDSQTSNSNTPPNITNFTDKGKIAHYATKVEEKYKINNPNGSLGKLEKNNTGNAAFHYFIYIILFNLHLATTFLKNSGYLFLFKSFSPFLDHLHFSNRSQSFVSTLDCFQLCQKTSSNTSNKAANH